MSNELERTDFGQRSPTQRRPSKTSSQRVTESRTASPCAVRIEDGRLVEEWGGLDLFDLRQQIEAVVTAGPDSKHGRDSDAEPRV